MQRCLSIAIIQPRMIQKFHLKKKSQFSGSTLADANTNIKTVWPNQSPAPPKLHVQCVSLCITAASGVDTARVSVSNIGFRSTRGHPVVIVIPRGMCTLPAQSRKFNLGTCVWPSFEPMGSNTDIPEDGALLNSAGACSHTNN